MSDIIQGMCLLQEMAFIKKQTDWDVAAYVNGVLDQMPKDFQCEPTFS